MLDDNLKMTDDEATQIMLGRYPESIAVFDSIELEALEMTDEMGHGIIQQFGI